MKKYIYLLVSVLCSFFAVQTLAEQKNESQHWDDWKWSYYQQKDKSDAKIEDLLL
jgi:hypothetical protein